MENLKVLQVSISDEQSQGIPLIKPLKKDNLRTMIRKLPKLQKFTIIVTEIQLSDNTIREAEAEIQAIVEEHRRRLIRREVDI